MASCRPGGTMGLAKVPLINRYLDRLPAQFDRAAGHPCGQPPEQLFPVAILPLYIATAMLAATVATVLAALLPARRAARLNPVDVIR